MVCSWNACVNQRLYELESKFSGLERQVKTLGQAILIAWTNPIGLYIFVTVNQSKSEIHRAYVLKNASLIQA